MGGRVWEKGEGAAGRGQEAAGDRHAGLTDKHNDLMTISYIRTTQNSMIAAFNDTALATRLQLFSQARCWAPSDVTAVPSHAL